MAVTVTKVDDEWVVNFPISDEDFIVLPADSERYEAVDEYGRDAIRYGTADTYLQTVDDPERTFSYKTPDYAGFQGVMYKTSRGRDTTTKQRETAFQQLEAAWESAVGSSEDEGAEIRRAEEEFDAAQAEARRLEAEATDESGMKDVPKGGRKRKTLRLKKQTRRSKRNTRNNTRRQSQKLTTRRR
jgi:hypothetical protein